MKVAVIGANGQLGSDLMRVLGEDAVPLTHEDVDVTDAKSLSVLEKLRPDMVINTASYVRVDDAEIKAEKAFQVNAVGALNVARMCSRIGAINVYISTAYVFDGAKGNPYVEDDPVSPINVYGVSKHAGELFTSAYSKRYYVIRVASLYGRAGARGKGGNFVDHMIQRARQGEELRVVDDVVMSPTCTKDVSEMLKKLLELGPEPGVYHMVNEGCCSWYELALEIFSILGWDVEIAPIHSDELSQLARRPEFSALENRRLHALGLRMRGGREALGEYLIEKGWTAGEQA